MPKFQPFQQYTHEYERWFEKNENIYAAELQTVQNLIPKGLNGVEVGVGTGRFALPLGIRVGVEPADNMAQIAREHGIEVKKGAAECLPLADCGFDYVLMVTAICFFDDVNKAFCEAYRVIKGGGFLAVAFIDRESDIGKLYQHHKQDSTFYRNAAFYSVSEVEELLKQAGFSDFSYKQTVYNTENVFHETKDGYGEGGFVAIKAIKQNR